MINTINHTINIDLANKINVNKSINIKKNDTNSHKFVINIFNNSVNYDLTGTSTRIYFLKNDNTKVFLDCVLDDILTGKISCILSTQVVSACGLTNSEITIYGASGEILTSVTFSFTVSNTIRDDAAIESVSEFTALTNALAVVTGIANKADKTYVDSQLVTVNTQLANNVSQLNANTSAIATAISGSPRNTYATLADLQTAHATDDGFNYLVSANNHIYDWISGAWTDTNVQFLPTPIADASVTPTKLSFLPVVGTLGKNLFDKTKITDGYYPVWSTGNLQAGATMSASDYTLISASTIYTVSHNHQLSFYDVNKVFISGIATPTTFTSPSNAMYVRIGILTANLSIYQFEKGSVKTVYEAYTTFIKTESLNLTTLKPLIVDFKNIVSKNLFDKTNITDGYYPNYNTGVLSASATYSASNFMAILPSVSYVVSHNYQIAFYDASYVYISGIATPSVFITPSNAVFARVGILTANLGVYQMEKGTVGTSYVSFGTKIGADTLDIDGIKNLVSGVVIKEIIVAPSGGDFSKISDAIASITDASELKHYLITVKEGTYNDTFRTKKYVDVVGVNKYKCIIDHTGIFANWLTESTIFGETTSRLENLWIKTYDAKYPVHSDAFTGAYLLTIKNCILEHRGCSQTGHAGTPLGIGIYENQFIDVIDCKLIGDDTEGCSGIFFHNFATSGGLGYRRLKVENCKISNVTYGFRPNGISDVNDQHNDALLINNDIQASTAEFMIDATTDLSWNIISRGNTLFKVFQPSNNYIVEQPKFTKKYKNTGIAILKGDVVLLNGANVVITSSDTLNSLLVVGVALEDISINGTGVVQTSGYVNNCRIGGSVSIANNDLLSSSITGRAEKTDIRPFAIAKGAFTGGGADVMIPIILLPNIA